MGKVSFCISSLVTEPIRLKLFLGILWHHTFKLVGQNFDIPPIFKMATISKFWQARYKDPVTRHVDRLNVHLPYVCDHLSVKGKVTDQLSYLISPPLVARLLFLPCVCVCVCVGNWTPRPIRLFVPLDSSSHIIGLFVPAQKINNYGMVVLNNPISLVTNWGRLQLCCVFGSLLVIGDWNT